ncbi:MAG: hypothetical protein IPJ39_02625 [Saprospiraceae bacterium]|nr:hypothetical protein [Saprospiraceae bacterium]
MESQLPELLKILTLTKNDDGTFIGRNLFIGSPNVYGGQVLAQAVAAANATVSDGKFCILFIVILSILATMMLK